MFLRKTLPPAEMVPHSLSGRATFPQAFSPPSSEDFTEYASSEEYNDRTQSNHPHDDPG